MVKEIIYVHYIYDNLLIYTGCFTFIPLNDINVPFVIKNWILSWEKVYFNNIYWTMIFISGLMIYLDISRMAEYSTNYFPHVFTYKSIIELIVFLVYSNS